MTPATSDAGRVVPITDRIEWLELFSDRGQHKRIPGPSAGDAWELAQELKPLAATLSALQRKLDAVGELADNWYAGDGYETGNPKIDEVTKNRWSAKQECAEELRALLGSDATTNEETK